MSRDFYAILGRGPRAFQIGKINLDPLFLLSSILISIIIIIMIIISLVLNP